MGISKHWPRIRRIWITVGLVVTAVFVTWSLIAYQADEIAEAATISDEAVAVIYNDGIWQFQPQVQRHQTSLVFSGHSRGAVVASMLSVRKNKPAGLVLIGTSHPRDVDLSNLAVPVTKIVGTRDGVAPPEKVRQNAYLLPATTRWIWVEGGNHSQFGWYGFQPMDKWAEISADEQRQIMTQAVIALLREVDDN